jgi:hypothetical protein
MAVPKDVERISDPLIRAGVAAAIEKSLLPAMGRVWYLEACACVRMKDFDRLRESTRLVCAMGEKSDWFWFERYHIRKMAA